MNQDAKKTLRIVLLISLFLFIIVFAFFKSRDLIFGVKITNVSIVDGSKTNEKLLHVTGNAKHAAILTLNGREISLNKQGDFDETIALFPGYNVISINAKDKFGSVDEKNYKLIMEAPNSFSNGLVEPTPLENTESATRGPEEKNLVP
ncbi:MAG: hypothetical protein AAB438_02435 [Patescibacteria group bacterium]